ncbi:hypothetical protein IT397_01435 [Candidatus Nomurabacteria bacterium]|nr:hypothetical protein [Candidatus Nomurabacteria bacterium]
MSWTRYFRRFNNPLFRIIFIIIILVIATIFFVIKNNKTINQWFFPPKILNEDQKKDILTNIAPPEPVLTQKEIDSRLKLLEKVKKGIK